MKYRWAISVTIFIAGFLCLPFALQARALTVQTSERSITLDDYVDVTVTVNARRVQLVVPNTDSFDIRDSTSPFRQPFQCMNMDTQVISGPCVFTYRFYPRKAGTLTIPKFKLASLQGGKVLRQSKSITVNVKPGANGATKAPPQRRRNNQRRMSPFNMPQVNQQKELQVYQSSNKVLDLLPLEKQKELSNYDLFLYPKFESDRVYVNQPIRMDVLLVASKNAQLQGIQSLELPELDGFRKEQIETEGVQQGSVRINGKPFNTYVVASFVLIPLQATGLLVQGAHAVAVTNKSVVQQFSGGTGFSFSLSSGGAPTDVYGPAFRLTPVSLPKERPAGFEEANVGAFRLTDVQIPDPQPAGSWVILRYTIEGEGNLFSVVPPVLSKDPRYVLRDPYIDRSNIDVGKSGIHGKVEVQLILRAKKAGTIGLPELKLVYFDPKTERFGESSLPPITLEALQPAIEAAAPLQVRDDELESISTQSAAANSNNADFWNPGRVLAWLLLWGGLYLAGVTARGVVFLIYRDPRRRKRRKALQAIKKEMKDAERYLLEGNLDGFHAAVLKVLSRFLDVQFGISVASSTHGDVYSQLLESNVSPELAERVRQELESSEFGRFAPSAVQREDMRNSLERTQVLLRQLDGVKARRGA